MKREDLEKLGLTKEQIDKVCDLNNDDMQPVKKDLQKAQDDLKAASNKVSTHETTINELKKDLDGFKDVDVSGLTKKITELETELKNKDTTHAAELADREFNDLLKDSISSAKGKNAKAITALLDMEVLKTSKNQKEDVAAALKALTEAEDSKMLFGEAEASPIGTGNIIGEVKKSSGGAEDAAMRAAMGLPPVTGQN